jgi:malonate-semialdehyde dehydrogenase (acetylating)/methylmalonate-semialdehyde dehydrogenase
VKTIEHWIGGKSTPGTATRHAPVWNPATGEQQAQVVLGTRADVEEAVRSAAAAFEEWSQASLSRRTRILFAFRELVNARVDELAAVVSDEHGKVLSDARGEVQRGKNKKN